MRGDTVRMVGEGEVASNAAEIGILRRAIEAELAGNRFRVDRRQLFLRAILFLSESQLGLVEKRGELGGKVGARFAVLGGNAFAGDLDAAGVSSSATDR